MARAFVLVSPLNVLCGLEKLLNLFRFSVFYPKMIVTHVAVKSKESNFNKAE